MAEAHFPSPSLSPLWAPSPSSSTGPMSMTIPRTSSSFAGQSAPSSSNTGISGVDFNPSLIAMIVVVASAFLLVTYSCYLILRILRFCRLWHRRRRRRFQLPSYSTMFSNLDSPPLPLDYSSPDRAADFHVYFLYGLDDSVIKTIPFSLYNPPSKDAVLQDCAMCLLEFKENDYVRTLWACFHPCYVDCIGIWLQAHANYPLCRARIFLPDSSPFVPVMSRSAHPSTTPFSFSSSTRATSSQFN